MNGLEDIGSSILISRLIAIRPKVSKQGQLLVATSDWRSQALCLGFAGRRVVVDPQQKTIRIQYRRFWFYQTSRRIQFDWVASVSYGYQDASTGVWAYQENDLFTVALQLKNGEEVVLFRFFGEGDFINSNVWPNWMYWDDFLLARYTKGPQESESLLYADLISRMIGVPIENPRP